jgi:hypothetical protein
MEHALPSRVLVFQKSVVVVTQLPFVTFFKRMSEVVGTMFFEAGSTVFEVAYLNAQSWCVAPTPTPCVQSGNLLASCYRCIVCLAFPYPDIVLC